MLTDRLLKEMPGILIWSLDGLDRLLKRGCFVMPKSSRESIRVLEDLGSPVRGFVRDKCVLNNDARITVDELFRAYKVWCEEQGDMRPGTVQMLGRNLKAAYPRLRIVQSSGGGRSYTGIELAEDESRLARAPNRYRQ